MTGRMPWAGELSCDLRSSTLAVSTEAMVLIDETGIAWATVLPRAGGFYEHAAFIVNAINAHDALMAALELARDDLEDARIVLEHLEGKSALGIRRRLETINAVLNAAKAAS